MTWIKDHQDDTSAYEKLSRLAKLNVDADHLARYRSLAATFQHQSSSPSIDHPPSSLTNLYLTERLTPH